MKVKQIIAFEDRAIAIDENGDVYHLREALESDLDVKPMFVWEPIKLETEPTEQEE